MHVYIVFQTMYLVHVYWNKFCFVLFCWCMVYVSTLYWYTCTTCSVNYVATIDNGSSVFGLRFISQHLVLQCEENKKSK